MLEQQFKGTSTLKKSVSCRKKRIYGWNFIQTLMKDFISLEVKTSSVNHSWLKFYCEGATQTDKRFVFQTKRRSEDDLKSGSGKNIQLNCCPQDPQIPQILLLQHQDLFLFSFLKSIYASKLGLHDISMYLFRGSVGVEQPVVQLISSTQMCD